MTPDPLTFDATLCDGAVVVGDDGSSDAADAVRWAAADAERRGVPLVVLRAWSLTSAPRPAGVEPGFVPSEAEYAAAVVAQLRADVATVLPSTDGVVFLPAHLPAEEALVAASRHAAVTVVGARGEGVARWLGSVSTHVVHRAHGPVVVVPQDGAREPG